MRGPMMHGQLPQGEETACAGRNLFATRLQARFTYKGSFFDPNSESGETSLIPGEDKL